MIYNDLQGQGAVASGWEVSIFLVEVCIYQEFLFLWTFAMYKEGILDVNFARYFIYI